MAFSRNIIDSEKEVIRSISDFASKAGWEITPEVNTWSHGLNFKAVPLQIALEGVSLVKGNFKVNFTRRDTGIILSGVCNGTPSPTVCGIPNQTFVRSYSGISAVVTTVDLSTSRLTIYLFSHSDPDFFACIITHDGETFRWVSFGKLNLVEGGHAWWFGASHKYVYPVTDRLLSKPDLSPVLLFDEVLPNTYDLQQAELDRLKQLPYFLKGSGGTLKYSYPEGTIVNHYNIYTEAISVSSGMLFNNTNEGQRTSNIYIEGYGWEGMYVPQPDSRHDINALYNLESTFGFYLDRSIFSSNPTLVPYWIYRTVYPTLPSGVVDVGAYINTAVIGEIPWIRGIRVDYYSPGDIICVGDTQWIIFPWTRKVFPPYTTTLDECSGVYGWAIKYDGP